MLPSLRKKYNAEFSEKTYSAFMQELHTTYKYPIDFAVSETPLFLSKELTQKLVDASYEIVNQLQTKTFFDYSTKAIPQHLIVPNETSHPIFLQVDFAICKNENGEFFPQLIELQGFPSLYGFQPFLKKTTEKYFSIPQNYTTYFSGLNDETYLQLLKKTILGKSNSENVILLEIEPENQKTRIDFACTETLLGIESVCVTKIKKRGKKLFYYKNGKEIPIERIYNRVIFDELERKNPPCEFRFTEELDVEWLGHPNWYFRISKHTLPFLKSQYVPPAYILSEIKNLPFDLQNYVLKPLYSFAGLGVEVEVTPEKLSAIQNKEHYLLQKKVEYTPLVETPEGFSKAEIRMMFIWNEKPMLVNNLVRMSKGKMMGVAFNKGQRWVGSSLAYHE